MDKCPICGENVRDTDRTCQCGELLQPWRTIAFAGGALRQRGLVLAERGNFLGACLSFLEATLANPLDDNSILDAAKSLARLKRRDEAFELLRAAGGRSQERAKSLAAAIASQVNRGVLSEVTSSRPLPPPPRPRRAVLRLPPIARKKPLLSSFRRDGTAEALWSTVIHAEVQWNGDWRNLGSWLDALGGDSIARGVFYYAKGLGQFQHAEDAATESFDLCVQANPPVMNAAAYWLYPKLGDPSAIPEAVTWLLEQYDRKDIDRVARVMADQLRDRLNERQQHDLRALSASCRGKRHGSRGAPPQGTRLRASRQPKSSTSHHTQDDIESHCESPRVPQQAATDLDATRCRGALPVKVANADKSNDLHEEPVGTLPVAGSDMSSPDTEAVSRTQPSGVNERDMVEESGQ